ncbi:MAG: CPBP family glutamic-type intramembrane protease [Nannocystaceae bacterium]
MEVAIAGASGFLGRHLCRHLRAAGHRSVALLRRPRPCPADRGVVVDFGDLPAVTRALDGVDALVNLVGRKRGSAAEFRAAHVDVPAALAAAATAAGVGRIVHISVAGCPAAEAPADGVYLATKAAGERVLSDLPVPVVVLRPGVIYGDGDDFLGNLAAMIRHAPIFVAPGGGRAQLQPVDVDDVCAAILAALTLSQAALAGPPRPYDVVGPERVTLRDLTASVARVVGLRLWIVPAPVALMRPVAVLLERASTTPVITRSQLALLSAGVVGEPAPARRDLGLTMRPLDDAAIRRRCADVGPWLGISLRPFVVAEPQVLAAAAPSLRRALALAPITVVAPLTCGLLLDDLWRSMPLAYVALVPLALALVRPPLRASLRPRPRALVVGALAAAALYGLGAAVLLGLDALAPSLAAQLASLELVVAGPLGAASLAILLWTIIGEELVWRGALLLPFAARLGPWPAVVVCALLYALAHASAGPPLLALAAAGAGIFWGWLRLRSGSLAATILCHLLWDLAVLALAPYGALL